MEYSCFHFHPLIASNYSEAYLLIKNNLTHIYPLKLVGSSGKAILKIESRPIKSQMGIFRDLSYNKRESKIQTSSDIYFNFNMISDFFRVKALENLNTTELAKELLKLRKNPESLTAQELTLITAHQIEFNITNVGNFPTEILSISIDNYGMSYNGFTLTKVQSDNSPDIYR